MPAANARPPPGAMTDSSPEPPDLSAYLAAPTAAAIEFQQLFPAHVPRTIFDIGACEGEDSVRFSRLFPNASVYAFEPLPANQELIRANFARYKAANATLVPLALSDAAGEATFHVSSGRPRELFAGEKWNYGNKSSSLLAPSEAQPMHGWIEFKERITVPTETLDHYCATQSIAHIDLVHMDVQGAEMLVLRGAARMLPHIGAVWLEVSATELYRGQALDRDIARHMRARGFALGHVVALGTAAGEGDHFYVNLRQPRAWRYLAGRRLRTLLARCRATAGHAKRRLLGSGKQP